MKESLLALLACPSCRQKLVRVVNHGSGDDDNEGRLQCVGCRSDYPIVRGVPRFVPADNYAASFGHQWNKYARLQLDSYNKTSYSRDRFYSITEWDPTNLRKKLVLDVGCGSGRFAEIALAAGAHVVAVDLSSAVDACYANLGSHADFHVLQASIYDLPFRDATFDYVYCIGVIQHTPDPRRAVECILKKAAPRGKVAFWIYELNWKSFVGTIGFKYLLRPWTRRQSVKRLEAFCARLERLCWPVVRWAKNKGIVGKLVLRFLPVCCWHLQGVSLSEEDLREWIRLDTFDMYSPAHDHPQTFVRVKDWLEKAGFAVDPRHPHKAISITGQRLEAVS